MARFGEAKSKGESYIPATDDCNFYLSAFEEFWFPVRRHLKEIAPEELVQGCECERKP
jgi:hypothetical protein